MGRIGGGECEGLVRSYGKRGGGWDGTGRNGDRRGTERGWEWIGTCKLWVEPVEGEATEGGVDDWPVFVVREFVDFAESWAVESHVIGLVI